MKYMSIPFDKVYGVSDFWCGIKGEVSDFGAALLPGRRFFSEKWGNWYKVWVNKLAGLWYDWFNVIWTCIGTSLNFGGNAV